MLSWKSASVNRFFGLSQRRPLTASVEMWFSVLGIPAEQKASRFSVPCTFTFRNCSSLPKCQSMAAEDRARVLREFRISRFGKPEPLFRQIPFHNGDALKRPRFHGVRTKQEMQVVHEPGPRAERTVRTGQAIDRHFGTLDKFLEEIAAEKTGRAGEQHAGPSVSRGRGKIRHVQRS